MDTTLHTFILLTPPCSPVSFFKFDTVIKKYYDFVKIDVLSPLLFYVITTTLISYDKHEVTGFMYQTKVNFRQ